MCNLDQFLKTKVSQGCVATRLRCGGIFNKSLHYTDSAKSAGERILKIGQYLAKL